MVKCTFKILSEDLTYKSQRYRQQYPRGPYSCLIGNEMFPTNVNEETFQGEHLPVKSNAYVSFFLIRDSQVEKIPNGIGKVFENLTQLTIFDSNLKTISKENLKQFPFLKTLNVQETLLEDLPDDLFEFNKYLERVWFDNNKIKYIGVRLLDKLPRLIEATFENNLSINIVVYKNDKESIEKFKQIVLSNCQKPKEEKSSSSQPVQKCPWRHLTKFHADLEKFSKIEEFKDFSIKVGAKEFKVHKFIFAARSKTFAEMIKNNPDADELVLEDIPVEVFESILNYVYKDEMPKNLEIAREIFAAAGKLKIEGLKENLTEILIQKMNDEENLNFLMENLNLGIKFESKDLKFKAFEEIKKHFPGKKLTDELLEQPEMLKYLIDTKKALDEQLKKFEHFF